MLYEFVYEAVREKQDKSRTRMIHRAPNHHDPAPAQIPGIQIIQK